jgi:hypothetical protein
LTSRERFPSGSTVGGDLGEWLRVQRFPPFADTEEDGGSTPPAPATPHLSRASADRCGPPVDEDRQREVADGRESVSLFNQGVHLGSQLSAGRSYQPGSRSARPGPLPASPTRLLLDLDLDPQTACMHRGIRTRAPTTNPCVAGRCTRAGELARDGSCGFVELSCCAAAARTLTSASDELWDTALTPLQPYAVQPFPTNHGCGRTTRS